MNQFDLTKFKKNLDGSYSKIATDVQPRDKALGKTLPDILKEQASNASYAIFPSEKVQPEIIKISSSKSIHFRNMSLDDVRIKCREEGSIFILGEVPSSKNSKQLFENSHTGKTFITSSEYTKKYLADTRMQWNAFRGEFRRLAVGKSFPLKVQIFFVRSTHRKFDYINISQVIFDCMTAFAYYPYTKNKKLNEARQKVRKDYCWIEDDNNEFIIPDFSAGYGYDPKLCGVIIKIL